MKELNDAQKTAVQTLEGPLLILAGAGAGKTKTISARVANLVKSGVHPHSILAITFTNKAAKEMSERIRADIEEDSQISRPISTTDLPFVSTFHALGVHIIRENAKFLNLPKFFNIYDKADSKQAIKEAIRSEGLDPKTTDSGKILNIISRHKGEGINLEQYRESFGGEYFADLVASIWQRYQETLRKDKALDFDDLLLITMQLLENENICKRYQSIWRYIHIDEYQDTNKVQYLISKKLASDRHNICVVGDIDQNIYSWRGARLRNILDFEKDYPEAKVVILEENYRSTGTILNAANRIIEKNKFRKKKNLFTKNPTGEKITIFEGFDEISEADFVARKTQEMIESDQKADGVAVLYRANFQSRVLEETFLSYGIPYQLIGTRFFERKEVKDVLAYLRLSISRENVSDLKRVINIPPRGIGKVSLLKIVEGKAENLPEKTRQSYKKFLELLELIASISKSEKPSKIIKFIIEKSGIDKELKQEGDDGEERLENLRELVTFATKFDVFEAEQGIEKMLAEAALQSDQDELEKKNSGVKLMTVHASKGLEFDTVFITGLEENLFPHHSIDEENISDEEEEEERRLFYVALTRARKKIFLSYSNTRTLYGSRQINLPSEFIFDIPDDLTVKEEGEFGLLGKPLVKIDF